MTRKPADLVPLMLRLPEELRRRIEREADRNQRSLNAEIVRRLEQTFQSDERTQLVARTVEATASDIFAKLKSGELKGPVMDTRRKKKP